MSARNTATLVAVSGDYAFLDYSDWLPRRETLQDKLRKTALLHIEQESLVDSICIPTLPSEDEDT